MENHHFQWENSLFLWPCSIANCWHHQRLPVNRSFQPRSGIQSHWGAPMCPERLLFSNAWSLGMRGDSVQKKISRTIKVYKKGISEELWLTSCKIWTSNFSPNHLELVISYKLYIPLYPSEYLHTVGNLPVTYHRVKKDLPCSCLGNGPALSRSPRIAMSTDRLVELFLQWHAMAKLKKLEKFGRTILGQFIRRNSGTIIDCCASDRIFWRVWIGKKKWVWEIIVQVWIIEFHWVIIGYFLTVS